MTLTPEKGICERLSQNPLKTLKLQIPASVIERQNSFHTLLILARTLAMRTLLLSCNDGKTQTSKISVVKIISQVDKTARLTCGTSQMKAQSKAQDNDTLLSITPPSIANIMGVIEIPSPDIKAKIFVSANDTKATYSMVNIDTPLIFKGKITAKNNEDARKKFQNDVPNYIVERLFVKFEMIP